MKIRNVLYADEGMVLTDGQTYGKVIYPKVGADISAWREIPKAEYDAAMAAESEGSE